MRTLAVVLAVTTAFALGYRMLARNPTSDTGLREADKTQLASLRTECEDDNAHLMLTIADVAPQARELDVGLQLCVPESLLGGLRDGSGRAIWREVEGRMAVGAKFRGLRVRVQRLGSLPAGDAVATVSLSSLFEDAGMEEFPDLTPPLHPSLMTFPLVGQPDSYPLDWYSSTTYIGLGLPPQVLFVRGASVATVLPLTIHVEAGSGVGDFSSATARFPRALTGPKRLC